LVVVRREVEAVVPRLNSKIAKLPLFDKNTNKVVGFVMACKLHKRIRMKKISIEE